MGLHDVSIDESAIESGFGEFEAVDEQRPAAGMVLQEPKPSEWAAMAKMASEILARQVCPNWQVPEETRQEWAEALAACLDQLFPGGLANIANWGPWAKLAYASVMWGMCGIDYSTMTLKPLREPIEGEGSEVPDGGSGEAKAKPVAPETASTGPHFMG